MNWSLIKQFPKYALALGLLVFSTLFFGLWWMLRSGPQSTPAASQTVSIAEIKDKMGGLFLTGNDLYDVVSGKLVAKEWLEGGAPPNLIYDSETENLFCVLPDGVIGYGLDGKRREGLQAGAPTIFTEKLKLAYYVKEKDIWRAEVDFKNWKLLNHRKVTSMGIFNERFFADNAFMASEKTLLMRNMNQVLRINVDTGEVKPSQVPVMDIAKRRSPDTKLLLGLEGNNFFIYDLDTDTTKPTPVGRKAISDFLWLDNNRCALLFPQKGLAIFDRVTGEISEPKPLVVPCYKFGAASADGQGVLCFNHQNGVAVNIATGQSEVLPPSAQGITWMDGGTYLYTSHAQNSGLHGTWVTKIGQEPLKVASEPYSVGGTGVGVAMFLHKSEMAVFISRVGLCSVTNKSDDLRVLEQNIQPKELRLIIKKGELP